MSRFSLLVPSLSLLAILIAIAPFARAQVAGPPAAQAATVAALAHYPDFYVNRSVSVRGRFTGAGASLALQDEAGNQVRAAWKDAARPDGVVDAYGTLWDLGRMTRDDPRLGGYDLTPWLGTGGEWPRPGDVYVFGIGRVQPAQAGEGDSIRAITLDGLSASGRRVTIVGQFRGRNLFGDLPRAPGVTRWEFVLTATGSAIWVSGMPPKGKEFDLDLNSRADSNVWLRVSGTVRERNGLMWIEPASVDEAKPSPDLQVAPTTGAVVNPFPPPEVLFSIPASGEIEVAPETTVRIQVSRDIDPRTLRGRIQTFYLNVPPDTPGPTFNIDLRDGRILTLKFVQPLERSRRVRIDLLEGIKGTDGQPLKPWSMVFTVGG